MGHMHVSPAIPTQIYCFISRFQSSTESLKLLCDLYVWRSHHLWKDPVVLRWLERNANAALDKVDGKNPVLRDYDAMRRRRYQGTPRNIIRHILLTDEKDLTLRLPRVCIYTTKLLKQ